MQVVLRRRRWRAMLANGGAQGGGGGAWTSPPADWRMPATVAVSAGLAGSQAALATASVSASAKSRPSITVNASATEYVEWTVAEAGNAILSWCWTAVAGTASVSKNGVDQGYAVQAPAAVPDYRRQAMLLSVQAGDVIRLTVVAGAANRTFYPLLHKKPATGPWDAHLVIGASREWNAYLDTKMEDALLAAYPTRDPIVFNYAADGATLDGLAVGAADAAIEFGSIVRYAFVGSVMGNNITNGRPYDASEAAALNSGLSSIHSAFSGAGWNVSFGSTSYRAYTGVPVVTPTSQTGGSLEYNDTILFPFIAANMPSAYDSSLLRARADEYLETLYDRANLADQVHGNSTHYANVRTLWVNSWFRYIYTGAWGNSQIETRVADAETRALDGSSATVARTAYDEATYAMLALASSAAKTALQARLTAIYDNLLYKEADAAVTVAETTRTQADKDAAQVKINAAAAAGASVTALQARLDAIVIITVIQTVKIRHGNTGAIAGWNSVEEGTTTGVKIANLNNDQGAATGWGYTIPSAPAFGGTATNSAQTSGIDWVPDAVLGNTKYYNTTGNGPTFKFTGLDNTKVYDLDFTGSRTGGTGKNMIVKVNGVSNPQFDAGNNTTLQSSFTNVVPVSGEITVQLIAGTPNNTFVYLSATRIREKNP